MKSSTSELGLKQAPVPIFVRAWTTYFHGLTPSTDKMGTCANFIRAVLQIECSVNGMAYPIIIILVPSKDYFTILFAYIAFSTQYGVRIGWKC